MLKQKIITNKKSTLISFFITIGLLLVAYAFAGMYPFGQNSILANDLLAQYVELMQYFRKVLLLKENLIYSYNIGFGKGMIGIIAYILSSPLNILLIFFDENNIENAILIITLIKYGLVGLGMNYYLNCKYNNKKYNNKFISDNILSNDNIFSNDVSRENISSKDISDKWDINQNKKTKNYTENNWIIKIKTLLDYLGDKYKKDDKNYINISFSLCYSLMAYNISYSLNIMFLDSVILLPILCANIIRFIRNDRKKGLIISLLLLIISNFYMAYIVILFSIIYFWYEIYDSEYNPKYNIFRKKFIKFLKYIWCIVVASMMSAFMTLPTYLSLVREDKVKSLLTIDTLYKTGDIITKIFVGSFDTLKTNGTPNLYCGLIILIFFIKYFISSKISKTDKIRTFIIILIMYLSMRIKPIYMIWHGLDSPNWFPVRFSFVISFMIIATAYNYYIKNNLVENVFSKDNENNKNNNKNDESSIDKKNIENINTNNEKNKCSKNINNDKNNIYSHNNKSDIKITIIISFMAIVLMLVRRNYISNTDIVINLLILCVYFVILTLRKQKIKTILLCTAIICELVVNTVLTINNLQKEIRYLEKGTYNESRQTLKEDITVIKGYDKGIYRIEKEYNHRFNNGLGIGYMGVDIYSSIYNEELHILLNNIGLPFHNKTGEYSGNTLLTDTLFGIKYFITSEYLDEYELLYETDEYGVYKNNNALPLAFVSNKKILDIDVNSYDNPFIFQNGIITNISGIDEAIFEKVEISKNLINLKKIINEDGIKQYEKIDKTTKSYIEYIINKETEDSLLYLHIGDMDKIIRKIAIMINDETIEHMQYRGIENIKIYGNDSIKMYLHNNISKIDENSFEKDSIYKIDKTKLYKMINKIKNQNIIKTMKNGYISIEVNNNEDNNILMTTIPYEKGWSAKLNGKKTKIEKIMNSFIGLKLEQNQNNIELIYEVPGLKIGIFISIIGILIFTLNSMFLEKVLLKKK